ncbi:hypothetical protein SAMN05443549_10895 [Flavobacterium fluvii]|uniref:Uncharacterized protein n=1 Tax=Flavobacterium fluvii TaxID=468056 RepID=A0A1M5NNQ5_9FLAO|nr:hypothetical protein SAMN05443549_10895 [Flavobacterium fluvii]
MGELYFSVVTYVMLRQFACARVAFLLIGVCFIGLIFFIGVQRISFASTNSLLMAISYNEL